MPTWRAVRGGLVPAGVSTSVTGIATTHRPPPSLSSGVAPCRLHKDAATRLPDDLARTLEDTFVALQSGNSAGAITLQACPQYIRQDDAADGQPWPGNNRTPGQRLALARIDRANAGLSFLLELLHATERVRVDGGIDQQMGDGAREGLLLACRGLAEYVDVQLRAA